jgi:hypothetical protein
MTIRRLRSIAPLLVLVWVGCTSDTTAPSLLPIAPVSGTVNQTLVLSIAAVNPDGVSIDWSYSGPPLPGLSETAVLAGSPTGAEFRWTPLASHVGTHQFDFIAKSESGSSTQSAIIVVEAGAGAAPVFIHPGQGGSYDVDVTPCVAFDIEVKDDDSKTVAIRAAAPLPAAATLDTEGPHRARFQWCPTDAQLNQSLSWTLSFEADDGDHPPTLREYLAILRRQASASCLGEPPSIAVVSPAEGAVVSSSSGYPVRAQITDDTEVRDPPVLYYTTTDPGPEPVDVATFDQTLFAAAGAQWLALMPPLVESGDGPTRVWYVISAIDNDDENGTECDKRTDTPVRTFLAITDGEKSADCGLCTGSVGCASAVCTTDGVCVPACNPGSCECIEVVTIDGGTTQSCQGMAACDDTPDPPMCMQDSLNNASTTSATTLGANAIEGAICDVAESDWFVVSPPVDTRVTWQLHDLDNADLDLELLDEGGNQLGFASTLATIEMVDHCVAAGDVAYGRVHLYPQSTSTSGAYTMNVITTPESCCENDDQEPDNSITDAKSPAGAFAGTLCPLDKDHRSFEVPQESLVTLWVSTAGDESLLVSVHGPLPDTTKVDSATGSLGSLEWAYGLDAGTYVLAISAFGDEVVQYGGQVTVGATQECAQTLSCPLGTACYEDDGCLPSSCVSNLACPEFHQCTPQVGGLATASKTCLASCIVDAECRLVDGEKCKWLDTGRGCEVTGSKQAGEACGKNSDCASKMACFNWPGGYCARLGCSSNSDCAPGTICGKYDEGNRCMKQCVELGDGICRADEGYVCQLKLGADGEFYQACGSNDGTCWL